MDTGLSIMYSNHSMHGVKGWQFVFFFFRLFPLGFGDLMGVGDWPLYGLVDSL